MCCNNTFCNAEADIENFEAKNQPRQGEQPMLNNRGDRNAAIRQGQATASMYSGSYSYERGATNLLSNGNDMSGFQGATSNHGHYDEPHVDILAQSRRNQLAEALG